MHGFERSSSFRLECPLQGQERSNDFRQHFLYDAPVQLFKNYPSLLPSAVYVVETFYILQKSLATNHLSIWFYFLHHEDGTFVGKDFFGGLQTLEVWMLNYTVFTIHVQIDAQM